MSEHPTVHTFPGPVSIVSVPKECPPLAQKTLTWPSKGAGRMSGKPRGTALTVPAGYDVQYELREKKRNRLPGEKATAYVTVVPRGAPQVTHAALTFHHETSDQSLTVGRKRVDVETANGKKIATLVPNTLTVQTAKLLKVTATSPHNPEHVGEGATAQEAIAALKKRVAEAETAAPPAVTAEDVSKGDPANVEARTGPSEELPKVMASLPGDEGDGEGTGVTDKVTREG